MKEDDLSARIAQAMAMMAGGDAVEAKADVIPPQMPQTPSPTFDREQRQTGVRQEKSMAGSGVGSPFTGQKKKGAKRSPLLMLKGFIEGAFSYKGMFGFGLGVALICFGANWMFYSALWDSFGVTGWFKHILGFGTSFGTTLFQVYPEITKLSMSINAQHQFALASKPDSLPDGGPVDISHLHHQYKAVDRNSKKFFEAMQWVSYAVESLLGVLFLGNVGTGLMAIGKLLMFFLSIVGTNWGIGLMLRAANLAMPSTVKEQYKALFAEPSKINLKRI